MNDMSQTIIPKSDQLNADDLIWREMTIKITGVTIAPGEQPVSIHFEGDNGKPYKACKSMCRVMVSAWGPDSKKYVGRSMTIYRDPKVKWAGMEVGGIRISHMSHIGEDMTMALTVTRANKKPFTVRPLTDAPTKAATVVANVGSVKGEHGQATADSGAAPDIDGVLKRIDEAKTKADMEALQPVIEAIEDGGLRDAATTAWNWQLKELKRVAVQKSEGKATPKGKPLGGVLEMQDDKI